MAPAKSTETSARRYCGLGNHYLQEPHKIIAEPHLLKFAKRFNVEIRANTLFCGSCFDLLQTMYAAKLRNAIIHFKKRQASRSIDISDVSSSNGGSSQSSGANINTRQPPANPATTSSSSSTDSGQPTTSAAAAAKRQRRKPNTPDDDDDESLVSLNAVNGTRLPHIQPIPKRRQANLSSDVLDIYMAGITGG